MDSLQGRRGIEPEAHMKGFAYLPAVCLLIPTLAWSNDFPTQARVEYVLQCMEAHGGQQYDTLYPCVCSIDKIASQFSYDEYVEAETIVQLRSTPGERGGIFRDTDKAKSLYQRFKETVEAAEKSCFVKRLSAGPE